MRDILASVRPEVWAIAVFSTVINFLTLTVPLFTMHLFDKVLSSHSIPTLVGLTVVAVVLVGVSGVLDGLRARIQIRAAGEAVAGLSDRVFEAVLERLTRNPGDATQQAFADIKELRSFLTGPAIPAFVDAPWAVLFLVIAFLLHPLLGLVSVTAAVVLIGLALLSDRRTRKRLALGAVLGAQAELFQASCLRGAEAATALGMSPSLRRLWRERMDESLLHVETAVETAAGVASSARAARQIAQMLILAVGAGLVLQREMGAGAMFASALMVARALSPVEQALNAWRGFVSVRQASARLSALLAAQPTGPTGIAPIRPEPRLVLKGVSAAAPGTSKAFLHGIDVRVHGGEIVGVVGPSAAGKSMLGRVMVGLIHPLAGDVRLGGMNMVTTPAELRGGFVGYLPQDVQLIDGTVRQAIARFDAAPDENMVVHAARMAGVHELVLRLPAGYDTPLGASGVTLSGGQRQRLALARALYGDPPLVVLDEPDASLDAEGNATLLACLRRLRNAQRAVVVISHHTPVINLADRIVELIAGRVQVTGPRDAALAEIRDRVREERQRRTVGAPA